MTSNYDILSKYINNFEIGKDITFEIIEEDFLKIKPVKIPIQDIFTMKIMGNYIFKFCNYLKWSYYDSIDMDIINMCKREWPNIIIDYTQIIRIICNAKLNYKYIGKVQYEILKYIDQSYQEEKSLEFYSENKIVKLEEYLRFRQQLNKYITELFNTHKLECNEIDLKFENLADKITNNFEALESDENLKDTELLLDNIENIIYEKVNILLKECIEKFKLDNKNEKNLFIFNKLKNKAMDDFVSKMDEIYKDVCTNKLNKLDENTIANIIELFIVNKEMSKTMFLLEIGLFIN